MRMPSPGDLWLGGGMAFLGFSGVWWDRPVSAWWLIAAGVAYLCRAAGPPPAAAPLFTPEQRDEFVRLTADSHAGGPPAAPIPPPVQGPAGATPPAGPPSRG